MEAQTIEAQVRDVLRRVFRKQEVDDLQPDNPLSKIGLNEFSVARLILSLEETFGITYENEEMAEDNFATLQQIVSGLESKVD